MLALSVKQPWASLIGCGAKTVEVRSWATTHRGELLIVSSRKPAEAWIDVAREDMGDDFDMPLGCAIAVVRLADVRPLAIADSEAAAFEIDAAMIGHKPSGAPMHFAWLLEDPREVTPTPIRGRLNLYHVDASRFVPRELVTPTRDRPHRGEGLAAAALRRWVKPGKSIEARS